MTAAEIVGRHIPPDSPASACAACGHVELVEINEQLWSGRINVAGVRTAIDTPNGKVLIMLCMNATRCRKRREAQEASTR